MPLLSRWNLEIQMDMNALDRWLLVLLPPGQETSEMLTVPPLLRTSPVRCLGSGDAARVSPGRD